MFVSQAERMVTMRRSLPLVVCVVLLAVSATSIAAQQRHTFGVNLRVLGSPEVGITWSLSPSLVLRPSIEASWDKFRPGTGSASITTTSVALDLDLLLPLRTEQRVTPYWGIGASLGRLWSDAGDATTWAARTIAGARFAVVDRVDLFGEIHVEYTHDSPLGNQRIVLGTSPIGIIVYLK
jgi:hypothetical protein